MSAPLDTAVLKIADQEFRPGQHGTVELPTGQLPSGNAVNVTVHVFRGVRPGPTLLFMGGVHGDEINGVEILRRCLRQKLFRHLSAGTVICVPLLNVYGFNNYSRDVPDGKDVNRSFPGSQSGSLASRIAYALTKNILPHCDLVVDFHTGGRGVYNYPQIRYTPEDDRAQDAAAEFGPPLIVESKSPLKSLRRAAAKLEGGPAILTYEGGENHRYDAYSIETGVLGIRRLLNSRGLREQDVPPPPSPTVVLNSSWVRASRAGLFQWTKRSGFPVRKGEPIGFIADPQGIRADKRVLSPRDGFIIGHNNTAVVSQGDALYNIGF